MTWPIKRLAHEAAEPFERIGAQLLRRGALLILGITCLAVSLAFFTIALYAFLRTVTEPEIATLSVGGIYLCAAVIFLGLARAGTRPAIPGVVGNTPWQSKGPNGFSRQIDRMIAPVFDALRDAGLERERAMLVAGSSILKEVTPLTGVALAIVTGFVLGRRLRKRR
jgi:hypothetical protein